MTSDQPITCSLEQTAANDQLAEWVALQPLAVGATRIPDGVRLVFPSGMRDQVTELADREQACCSFLTITTAIEPDGLVLSLTTQHPEAFAVITALSGVAID